MEFVFILLVVLLGSAIANHFDSESVAEQEALEECKLHKWERFTNLSQTGEIIETGMRCSNCKLIPSLE